MDKATHKIGFYVTIDNGAMTVKPDDSFNNDIELAQWGRLLCQAYPGPQDLITIDLGNCKRFISAFVSQIIQLRDYYLKLNPDTRIRIVNASQKMRQIMQVMAIDSLFEIQ